MSRKLVGKPYQSPEYQALLVEWERQAPDKRGEKPRPLEVWEDVWGDFIELVFVDTSDRLKIQLTVSTEPIATNGTWERIQVHYRRR